MTPLLCRRRACVAPTNNHNEPSKSSAMSEMNQLPADLLAWVGQTTDATVTRCTRHNARREAWHIEARNARGESLDYFLRIDRAAAQGHSSRRNLQRETALIRALEQHGIPSQRILGWNDSHASALQSWVTGRAELNREPAPRRHAVLLEFMEILARLHRIGLDELDLPDFERPVDAADHALLELAAVENAELFSPPCTRTQPLAAFGKRWLINHAPSQVQATVLLQGDTGPANFLFDDSGVTALVDWEWGHYGDPLEDLGNIWVRDFFYPSSDGNLAPYFEHYAAHSGFTLDRDSIRYYRVHQMVRSVIGLAYLNAQPDWRMPIPLNLGYTAIIDLETCRSIAQARRGDAPLEHSAVPLLENGGDNLHTALALQMEQWVAPQIDDAATAALTRGHAATLRYLERRERCGAAFDAEELHGLRGLLGTSIADLARGRAALIEHIGRLRIEDEAAVLEHLTRIAANQAALMAPLTTPWQDCRWAAF